MIHKGIAVNYDTIHRNTAAGADDDRIAYMHILHGDLCFHAVAAHRGGLGPQIHQLTDGIAGLSLGSGFQEFAKGHQGQDHSGGLKI